MMTVVAEIVHAGCMDGVCTMHGVYLQTTGLGVHHVALFRRSADVSCVYAKVNDAVKCVARGSRCDTVACDRAVSNCDDAAANGISDYSAATLTCETDLVNAIVGVASDTELVYLVAMVV